MFSGQGAQYFHMAEELWKRDSVFRQWMAKLDAEAVRLMGESIVARIFDTQKKKGDRFDSTLHTHPALFMVQYSLAKALEARGIVADVATGASLGEVVAATVVGALEWHDGLAMTVAHARAISETCSPGGMIAVLDDAALYSESELGLRLALVSVNSERHFVVSGDADSIRWAGSLLKSRNTVFQVLPVSHGFHSRMVDPSAERFTRMASGIQLQASQIPFFSCLTAQAQQKPTAEHFWNVARYPILFRETLNRLEASGPNSYLDLGPAGTMANLTKYALPRESKSGVHSILTAFGCELQALDRLTTLMGAA